MVSIIIPTRQLKRNKNLRHFHKPISSLPDLIESIVENVSIEFEIVVIVNGINDEKLEKYVRSSQLINKYSITNLNTGVARAWNIGRMLAEGDKLLYVNDDVTIGKNAVEKMSQVLCSDGMIGQVGPKGGLWTNGQSGERKGLHTTEEAEEISGYCFMTKTSVFDQIGGFDVFYTPAGCEEIDFSFSVRKAGYKCLVIPHLDIRTEPMHGISGRSEDIEYFKKRIHTKELAKRNKEYFINKWY